ncbi:MAG: orotate phosphoribosyltransferase [Bdellovibrionaceae bacterium]|nr:orotate phosphoribosyltransferase [Pseudobdellovibrionaceae bacterium]|tara:strand:- start:178 stop:753 length:576 start_codon:yes stop_codon:yes gene_type:complete
MDRFASDSEQKKRLIEIIRKVSYREGDFTLASGQKSRFYVNLKMTTLHPEGATLIGQMMTDQIKKERIKIEAVGGLTLGADPIATAVSIAAFQKGIHWPAFIVRKTVKDHGTQNPIEGAESFHPGTRVMILEDVSTTGGSSLEAVEKVREAGFLPVGVFTVVDREQGAADRIRAAGLPYLSLCRLSEIQNF